MTFSNNTSYVVNMLAAMVDQRQKIKKKTLAKTP